MATKKTENQVKVAMAKVEAAKAAEVAKVDTEKKETAAKIPAKSTETKTTAAKASAKSTETKATAAKAPAKKAATKTTAAKAPAKKAATKTTAAKKAPAKKVVAPKTTQTVHLQVFAYDVTTDDITAKVLEAVGKKAVKELNIYVKPEDGMIYYTADGEQGKVAL